MRTTLRTLTLTALALTPPSLAGAQLKAFRVPPDAKKIHKAVAAELESNGLARVIVQLQVPMPAVADLSRRDLGALDAQIEQAQAAVRHKLRNVELDEHAYFRHFPLLVFQADTETVDALSSMDLVRNIRLDRSVEPSLADSVPLVHAPTTWRMGNGSRGASSVVAVLDTGFDLNHPFYGDRVVDQACFSDDDRNTLCPNGETEQLDGNAARQTDAAVAGFAHGTHVAGIAAGFGRTPDGVDLAGVAPRASLALVTVFHRVESVERCAPKASPCVRSWDSDVLLGLEHSLDLRVEEGLPLRAVNLSLGGGHYTGQNDCRNDDPGYEDAVHLLNCAGVAVVAASGNGAAANDGTFLDGVAMPACVPGVVAVGNSDKWDTVAFDSQAGPLLDLLAPGEEITSSVPDDAFGVKSGTSMAAPHVAGAIALLADTFPAANHTAIVAALRSTGVSIGDARSGAVFNYPRIDVEAAARLLARNAPLPQAPAPTALRLSAAAARTTAGFTWNDSSDREMRFELVVELPNRVTWGSTVVPANAFGAATQSGTISGLRAGTAYLAKVRACDAFERCSAYSPSVPFTTFIQLPPAPTGFRVLSKDTTRINLGWNAQAGLTRWTLNAWGGTPAASVLNPVAGATSQAYAGRLPGETYHFSLRACNADGCGPDALLSVTTDAVAPVPAAPSALALVVAPAGQVSLRWVENAVNETGIEVWRALGAPGFGGDPNSPAWSPLATVAANTTTWTGPVGPAGTISYFRVRACNLGVCSPFSPSVARF
jgi:subtilisin family serine protease